jgi:hypothetical protein
VKCHYIISGKYTIHNYWLPSSTKVKNAGSYTSISHASIMWCLSKHKGNFTFTTKPSSICACDAALLPLKSTFQTSQFIPDRILDCYNKINEERKSLYNCCTWNKSLTNISANLYSVRSSNPIFIYIMILLTAEMCDTQLFCTEYSFKYKMCSFPVLNNPWPCNITQALLSQFNQPKDQLNFLSSVHLARDLNTKPWLVTMH